MGYLCPACHQQTLIHHASMELPADALWDEITLSLLICKNCGAGAASVYTESRRGSLVSEAWEHAGFILEGFAVQKLQEMLAACPDPANKRCTCPVHQALGKHGPDGKWSGLENFQTGDPFPLLFPD